MTDLSLSRSQMLLLSGSANRALAEEVAAHLGQPLCQVTLRRFADGEIFVSIDENVRGRDVYIIQPTNPPADNMMELLLLMDAAKRASAARVTAVIPYFGYARQDRKDQPRVAISAKLMANMIVDGGRGPRAGDRLPPAPAAGVLRPPGRSPVRGAGVGRTTTARSSCEDLVVVAPDVGSAKMARGFAKRLNATLAIIDKRRPSANVAEVLNVVGEVTGRDCLIPDDMIDTAGTMAEAAKRSSGWARATSTAAPRTRCSRGPAVERLMASPVKEVTVTNTVALPPERRFDRLKVLSIAGCSPRRSDTPTANSRSARCSIRRAIGVDSCRRNTDSSQRSRAWPRPPLSAPPFARTPARVPRAASAARARCPA